MFLLKVKPWKSSRWVPPDVSELEETDRRKLVAAGKLSGNEVEGQLVGDEVGEKKRRGSQDALHIEGGDRV
jgi:hypothetical protein